MKFLTMSFLFFSLSLSAQTMKQAQKTDQKLHKQADTDEIVLLDGFSKGMKNYSWENLSSLIMEEHVVAQMEMYLTDEVMFNHLGRVGERDVAAVRRFYVRETFALTKEEEGKMLRKKFAHKNFFDFTNLEDAKALYWIKSEIFGEVKIYYFLIYTKSGQSFVGRIMLVDTINGMRIVGPMG